MTVQRKFLCFAGAALLVTFAVCAERTAAREGSSAGSAARTQSQQVRRRSGSLAGESMEKDRHRLREGTVISDQSGFFREDGDGATFISEAGFEFGALPNLNLERVLRLLKSTEEPSSIRWSVTGKVTEFSGRNFLLIRRAVYKSASLPPVPDRIAE